MPEPQRLVARWETRGKRYWLELYQDGLGYSYVGDNSGGSFGSLVSTDAAAIQYIERMVEVAKADSINLRRVY